jgi:hypothetical protein
MKIWKFTICTLCLLAVVRLYGDTAIPDFSGMGSGLPEVVSVIKKLCGGQPSFSANATVELTDTDSTNTTMRVPSVLTFSGNDMRWDWDVGQMTGSIMPPEISKALKNAKLDKINFISRFDEKASYVVFPGVCAYVRNLIPDSEISRILQKADTVQLKSEVMGKEIVDGYSCTKTRITIPEEAKFHESATVWSAPELTNRPVKLELDIPDGTLIFHFRNVTFDTPPAGIFDTATNFICKADAKDILDVAAQQLEPREPELTGKIASYGIVLPGKMTTVDAPTDPTGKHSFQKSHTTTPKVVTNRIPAKLGVAFGCLWEISGQPDDVYQADIETVWKYPTMVKMDGSISKGFSYDYGKGHAIAGVKRWDGYVFEKEFELVPGEWTFELKANGKTIATQNFVVYLE